MIYTLNDKGCDDLCAWLLHNHKNAAEFTSLNFNAWAAELEDQLAAGSGILEIPASHSLSGVPVTFTTDEFDTQAA